jgi:hypothetical protein
MAASLTKSQLIDQLAALREHCNHVETELASLKAARPAAQGNRRPAYVHQRDAAAQEAHDRYAAALAAARQLAMAGGKAVVVQR